METELNKHKSIKFATEVTELCLKINNCRGMLERNSEERLFREQLEQLCREVLEMAKDLNYSALLIALFDAYEITRDEAMLQQVLDVVGDNLEHIENSSENVKLLSYCYYYTEDEECALLARKMIRWLQAEGEGITAESMAVFRDLVEEY